MKQDNLSAYTFLEQELKRLKAVKEHYDNSLYSNFNFYEHLHDQLDKELSDLKSDFFYKNEQTDSLLHKNIANFFNKSFGLIK